jgi:hypothetical protein
MRVTGGGALSRHADITDRSAGIADGRIARIHVPIITNPAVVFRSIDLDGGVIEHHMPEGEATYLDVRKPHAATNGGTTDRVHLVIDVASSPALRAILP